MTILKSPIKSQCVQVSVLLTLGFSLLMPFAAEARAPFVGDGFGPDVVADVAEQVAPSVVNIDIERTESVAMPDFSKLPGFFGFPGFPGFQNFPGMPNSTPNFGGDSGQNGNFFQFKVTPDGITQFPGPSPKSPDNKTNPKTQPPQHSKTPGAGIHSRTVRGNGSGVVLHDGYILTNNHVVRGADNITITTQDGEKISAKVLGTDAYTDIAVLKAERSDLKPAVLGRSDNLRPGEWVLAIGSPLGYSHTVTLGIVSGLARKIPDPKTNLEYIQTDAAINQGNSGGPLVNLQGEVIGINTAISARGQNIGFAIPVDVAKEVAETIIKQGKVTRPYLGISMTGLTPPLAKSLGLNEDTEGVAVAQVLQGSPAELAGLRHGDIIQRMNGKRVSEPKEIQEAVQAMPLKSTLNLQILREGSMKAVAVKTDAMPQELPTARQSPQIQQQRSSQPNMKMYRYSFP